MEYSGYEYWTPTSEKLSEFYMNKKPPFEMIENQYLIIKNEAGQAIDKYCYQNGDLRKVKFITFDNIYTGKIKPRNAEQECAFDMLTDDKTAIKLITGRFGTGKTLLLVTAALQMIDKGKFDRIVWVRNNVQVKDTDNIGALPGTEFDKIFPYLGPFIDHVGGEYGLQVMIQNHKLEAIPLGFLRGRSIKNSIIMCSEAENLTKEHIQLLMGRIDEGSNLWLDADLKQRDRQAFEKSRGVETMIERLAGEKLYAYTHLVKTERSEAAALADKLD